MHREALNQPRTPSLAALPWWRRRRAILVAAFLLVVVTFGVHQGVVLVWDYREAEATATRQQAELARALAVATELFVARYRSAVQLAAEASLDPSRPDALEATGRRVIARLRRALPEVGSILVTDRTGRAVAATPPQAVGGDYSGEETFRRLVAGAAAVVGDAAVRTTVPGPGIMVAAAIRGPDGGFRGTVAVELPVADLARTLGVRLAGGSSPLVVDRAGRAVLDGARPDLDRAGLDYSLVLPVSEALAGAGVRSGRFGDPRSRQVMLGTLVPVPGLGWAAGIVQPLDAALAPAREQLRLAVATAVAATGLGIALAVALSVWLSRPITALAAGFAALSQGDLSHRVPVRGRHELAWLADRFNEMAAQLEAARRQRQVLSEELAAANAALQRRVAELQTLLEVLPVGIAVASDPQCRHITANPALAEFLGVRPGIDISPDALPDGRPPFRIYRDGRELAPEELPMQYAASHGVMVSDVEVDVVRGDGTTRKLLEWAVPLFDEAGSVRGCFLVVVDITERKQVEEALRVRARQQAVVAELGQRALAGLEATALMAEAVMVVSRTLDVECAKVLELLPGGERLLLRAGIGWPPEAVGHATVGAGRESQAGYTLLSRAPVIVEDWATETRFRQPPVHGHLGLTGGITVLIDGPERPFGVLGAHTARRRSFTRDDVHFLQAVAHVLATAIQRKGAEEERARLLRLEQAARAEAEATQQRAAFLGEASRHLAASLDSETTLASIARLAVPHVADWCVIDLVGADRSMRAVIVAHVDPAKEPLLRELYDRYPPALDVRHPDEPVFRTGQARLVADITDTWLAAVTTGADHLALARRLAPRSVMCVPLTARGRTLGVLSLVSAESGRRYGPADLALAEELARRAAVAIDNARLYREAQEAVRARDDFLARASHELRTPLTVIKGHLAFLAKRPVGGDADAAALIATARRHADQMTRLLADLLDASRLTAGRLPLEPESLDLAAVTAEALEQAAPLAHAKGLALVNDVPAGLTVMGDRLRLEQVLVNLVTNAIKHTPAGGRVLVEGIRSAGQVELRVRDTGEGIPREHLMRIFEPFFQVESADGRRKAARGGAGLGLAIVRQLVELHGGRIWAESEGPGRGSTFVVRLPATPARGRAA